MGLHSAPVSCQAFPKSHCGLGGCWEYSCRQNGPGRVFLKGLGQELAGVPQVTSMPVGPFLSSQQQRCGPLGREKRQRPGEASGLGLPTALSSVSSSLGSRLPGIIS